MARDLFRRARAKPRRPKREDIDWKGKTPATKIATIVGPVVLPNAPFHFLFFFFCPLDSCDYLSPPNGPIPKSLHPLALTYTARTAHPTWMFTVLIRRITSASRWPDRLYFNSQSTVHGRQEKLLHQDLSTPPRCLCATCASFALCVVARLRSQPVFAQNAGRREAIGLSRSAAAYFQTDRPVFGTAARCCVLIMRLWFGQAPRHFPERPAGANRRAGRKEGAVDAAVHQNYSGQRARRRLARGDFGPDVKRRLRQMAGDIFSREVHVLQGNGRTQLKKAERDCCHLLVLA